MCYHTRSPFSKDSKVFRTHKILTISLMFGVSPENSRQHIYSHGGKRHYRFFLFAINWTWMCRKWASRGVWNGESWIIWAFYLGLYRAVGAPFLVLHFKIIQSYFPIKRYGLISRLSPRSPLSFSNEISIKHPYEWTMFYESKLNPCQQIPSWSNDHTCSDMLELRSLSSIRAHLYFICCHFD